MRPAPEPSVLRILLNRSEPLQQKLLLHGNTVTGFSENETVSVRILTILKNNTIRIAVNGTVLQARASSDDIQEGAFLLMRVNIENNTLILTPERNTVIPQFPHGDVFTQLGIPQSDLAAALVTFFRQNEQPLQSRPLLKILSSLRTFAPHEKKAAFAAALLYSRGIDPTPPLIEQCLAAVFGFPKRRNTTDAEEPDDTELFQFLNHVKRGGYHWVVFPFEKKLTAVWKGSAAFLLDLCNTACLECCLRVRSEEKRETWIFTLKNGECLFSYQGNGTLSAVERKRLTELLAGCLKSAGASSYTVRYAESAESKSSLASIDISV